MNEAFHAQATRMQCERIKVLCMAGRRSKTSDTVAPDGRTNKIHLDDCLHTVFDRVKTC